MSGGAGLGGIGDCTIALPGLSEGAGAIIVAPPVEVLGAAAGPSGLGGLRDVSWPMALLFSKSELVVIVTPYLVKPVARQELARPLDGLAPASDRRANFLGHLNRIYGRGRALPAGDLKGDYGFIVE